VIFGYIFLNSWFIPQYQFYRQYGQIHRNYKNQTYEGNKTFVRARFEIDLTDVTAGGKLSPNMFTQVYNARRPRSSKQPLSQVEGRAFLPG
jgi:hypothetical protein